MTTISITDGRRRGALTGMLAGAMVALLAAVPAHGNHDLYRQVSQGEINGNGSHTPLYHAVSTNGNRVFFTTYEQLVMSDADARQDVYERSFGTTRRVSAGAINGNGAFDANYVGSSADGSRVFFTTIEKLVAADTDSATDVYQRSNGTTTLISAGQINGNGNYFSQFYAASEDGSKVFFSTAEALVAADTDSHNDVYQRSNGATTLVSVGQINGNTDFGALFSGLSANGNRVWFSTSEKLVAADTDTALDIYERSNGQTFRVSRGVINGNGPNSAVLNGAAANGARVFFTTSEKLHPSDSDSAIDIYAFNNGNGTIDLISAGQINGNGVYPVTYRSRSADGSKVFFVTAERLVNADTDVQADVYERSGGTTKLISYGNVNGNGNYPVTFERISSDGSRVIFSTDEKLAVADTDAQQDIYIRSGVTLERVSASATGGNAATDAWFECASLDTSKIFFRTSESLSPWDIDGHGDVYERSAGATDLMSHGDGPYGAAVAGCSRDGSAVIFETNERLQTTDKDASPDLYGAYLD